MAILKSHYPCNPPSNRQKNFPIGSGTMGVPLLLLFIVLTCGITFGQGNYTLNGRGAKSLGKSVTLTVYDSESSSHSRTKRVKDGEFVFSGHLSKPCVAEMTFANGQNLYLYLEPAEMNVEVNADDLEHSPVTGSRTNSQYRYAMENSGTGKSLASYIQENRNSPIAAFVLFRQMRNMEIQDVEKLFRTLDSTGARCYHYLAIKNHIDESVALSEGNPLPDFEFIANGKSIRFAECIRNDTMTVLFFGAQWCDICQRDLAAVKQLCGDSVTCIIIDLDSDRRGWDAPYISKLDIAHLPFIILLDPKGRILARDVRIWELERHINDIIHQENP